MAARIPTVLFRADASPAIGTGHVMRCLTLAGALAERGFACRLACTAATVAAVAALAQAPVALDILPDHAWNDPAAIAALPPADWLVVDHYRLDFGFERVLRSWAGRILAIDDLALRRHDCDVLLDQTPGRDAGRYHPLCPASAMILAGAGHALLRPDFVQARAAARRQSPRHLLVSLGGTDPADATSLVLDAVDQAGLGLPVVVAMGRAAPHLERVRARAAAMTPPAEIRVDVADMAALMAGSLLAVGAAGTSALERCCVGLPSVMLVIADNQKEIAEALDQAGAALVSPPDEGVLARHLRGLAGDEAARRRMADRARAVCDGGGAARLADLMSLGLRPARPDDADDLLAWRNDPTTRANSLDTAEVARSTHLEWMERALADRERLILIGERFGAKVGMVRFDLRQPGEWRVSITIAPAARGQGIGRALLAFAIQALERRAGPQGLWAEIRESNLASLRIFAACGFALVDQADGVRYFRRPPS